MNSRDRRRQQREAFAPLDARIVIDNPDGSSDAIEMPGNVLSLMAIIGTEAWTTDGVDFLASLRTAEDGTIGAWVEEMTETQRWEVQGKAVALGVPTVKLFDDLDVLLALAWAWIATLTPYDTIAEMIDAGAGLVGMGRN